MNWFTLLRREIPFGELEREQGLCLAALQKQPARGFLLLSEPKPTFTFGRSATGNDCLWSEAVLHEKGIETFAVTRGGQWTYHGPGQVLLYPIVSLTALGYPPRGIRPFLCDLRRGVQAYLKELGIESEGEPEGLPFGVYVGGAKLVSFGICMKRDVCTHGLALYLSPQTNFAGIHPCGVAGQKTTSLEELGARMPWETVAFELAASVRNHLGASADREKSSQSLKTGLG